MEISDRAKGEGLQIPLFNAAGLQIRPNGFSNESFSWKIKNMNYGKNMC